MILRGTNQYKTRHGMSPAARRALYIARVALYGFTTGILFSLALVIWYRFFTYRVISPCPDMCANPMVKVVHAKEMEVNTPEGIVRRSKHPDQIMRIWEKESTFGRNKNPQALHNICRAKGKSNEFGYGGMARMICFDTFKEAVETVDTWLSKRDNEALCYYNLGVKTGSCSYLK